MKKYDIVVIGGGALGCFAARNLMRYKVKVAVIEKNADICTEISRANTSVVYSGYDNKPGTMKARLCVEANKGFDGLCGELCVPFKRCGSLMAAVGPRGERTLRRKMEQGAQNGVPGLRLLSGAEALALEPGLTRNVSLALYSPSAGVVNPWELVIAAAENAVEGGAELFLGAKALGISRDGDGYLVQAGRKTFAARAIINCAGLFADEVSGMAAKPYFKIAPTHGDYIVLDTKAGGLLRHVVFYEPEKKGKGATLVPTVDGNIMLGPSDIPAEGKTDFSASAQGLAFVRDMSEEAFPGIAAALDYTIRSFATLRPNPFWTDPETGGEALPDKSINDFVIGSPEGHPRFVNLAGIKTPGLTCSNEIGRYAADLIVDRIGGARANPEYNPRRYKKERFSRLATEEKMRLPGGQRIVCRCCEVTEEEIRDAIRRTAGATTVDGIKRRAGACMGRCQGGYCTQRIIEILSEELGVSVSDIRKDGPGSFFFKPTDEAMMDKGKRA